MEQVPPDLGRRGGQQQARDVDPPEEEHGDRMALVVQPGLFNWVEWFDRGAERVVGRLQASIHPCPHGPDVVRGRPGQHVPEPAGRQRCVVLEPDEEAEEERLAPGLGHHRGRRRPQLPELLLRLPDFAGVLAVLGGQVEVHLPRRASDHRGGGRQRGRRRRPPPTGHCRRHQWRSGLHLCTTHAQFTAVYTFQARAVL